MVLLWWEGVLGVAALVGRQRELARLGELIDEASAGVGGVVALAGPTGMGKSRLASECLAVAAQRGFLNLSGNACPYQGDLSYAPLVEALRPLVVGRDAPIQGLSELGRLFDGLPTPPPPTLGDPGLERTRLFEAIAELVRRAAERQPVVLLIEDVHWADVSSLDALHYLGRAVAQNRLLLVLTYRPAEANAALRGVLTSLRRGEWLAEIPVEALSPAEVATLAGEILGGPAPDPLLDLLGARAAGVPLFVRELTIALRDGGGLFRSGGRWVLGPGAAAMLTSSVLELFEQRVASLGPEDRAVLEAIAVCADAASFELISAVCGDDPDLAARLERLRAAGLVVEDLTAGEVVHRTSHPLLAEAVYAGLPARVRQARHASVAKAIDSADVSRLAHHVGRAGTTIDPARALAVLSAAAEAAVARRAGEEGLRHATDALALARRLGRTNALPGLLELQAESAFYAGMISRSIQCWQDAAAASTAPVDRARRLLQLAQLETEKGRLVEASGHLDRARDALGELPAVAERVDIAEVGLVLHTRAGDTAGATAVVEELQRIAEATGHQRAAALARYGRLESLRYGMVPVDESEVDKVIAEVASVAGAPLVACLQRISMGSAIGRGEPAVVARRAERGLELARSAGLPMLGVIPSAFHGFAMFEAGAWDSALALSDRTLVLAHRFGNPWGIALALACRAMVALHRGDLDEVQPCLDEAEATYGRRRSGRLLAVIAAQLALVRGDVERALELVPREGPFAFPVLTLRVRAEAHLAAGELAEVGAVIGELEALGFRYATVTARRLRGLVAGPDGAELLAGAVAALDPLALPFDAALCRLELAAATADPAAAVAPANHALATLDDLGAVPSADRTRRLLRGLGAKPKPAQRRPGVLSSRETEVAELVAQGLSNAAVAQRLFLSPRTITTHLDHIYRRLGLSSRAELARYVAERQPNT
jgi:DNA-binding CsgD family transcriptional regulator